MTTKALCWSIVRTDGIVLLGTARDTDLVVTASGYAGTYKATNGITASNLKTASDGSVDNITAQGALFTIGVQAIDIEAGLFDEAACVVFETDWTNPSTVRVLRAGSLGQLTRTSDKAFTFEIRGKMQLLQQPLSATYQNTCRAELFSGAEAPAIARCGLDPAAYVITGAVSAVTSPDRAFVDTAITVTAGYYTFGKLTFTSGLNSGFTRGVKVHGAGGTFELVEQLPYDITIGDAYTLLPGCNKLYSGATINQAVTTGGTATSRRASTDWTVTDISGTTTILSSPVSITGSTATISVGGSLKITNIDGDSTFTLSSTSMTIVDRRGTRVYPTSATEAVSGDCRVKFNNLVNYRGDPFIPGDDTLVRQQQ